MAQYQGMTEAAKSYKFPGEYMYKGVTYVDGIPLSSIEKIEEDLELNSQDIIIACFPKSGNSPVARPGYPSKFWGNHFIAFFDRYDGPD